MMCNRNGILGLVLTLGILGAEPAWARRPDVPTLVTCIQRDAIQLEQAIHTHYLQVPSFVCLAQSAAELRARTSNLPCFLASVTCPKEAVAYVRCTEDLADRLERDLGRVPRHCRPCVHRDIVRLADRLEDQLDDLGDILRKCGLSVLVPPPVAVLPVAPQTPWTPGWGGAHRGPWMQPQPNVRQGQLGQGFPAPVHRPGIGHPFLGQPVSPAQQARQISPAGWGQSRPPVGNFPLAVSSRWNNSR